jgi:hypothetical protein
MHQLKRGLDFASVERAIGGPQDQFSLLHGRTVSRVEHG